LQRVHRLLRWRYRSSLRRWRFLQWHGVLQRGHRQL